MRQQISLALRGNSSRTTRKLSISKTIWEQTFLARQRYPLTLTHSRMASNPTRYKAESLRPHLYGLGYPRQPPPFPRDNFTERLYDKKLARLAEIKLTLLNYSEILL